MFETIRKIFNKHSLISFFSVSILIHASLIASSPKIRALIKSHFPNSVVTDNISNEAVIEFVLNEEVDSKVGEIQEKEKQIEIADEIAEVEDFELEENERPVFVDTSGLKTDEELPGESEKIGEKSSVARDMRDDNDDLDGDAFSEGEAEWLALEKDVYAVAPEADQVYAVEDESKSEMEQNEQVQQEEEMEPQEGQEADLLESPFENEIVEAEEYPPEEHVGPVEKEVQALKNEELIEEQGEIEEVVDKVEEVVEEEMVEELAKTLKKQNEYEVLRDFDSEFERIVPEPEELRGEDDGEDLEEVVSENDTEEVEEKDKENKDLARMTPDEREEMLKEIYETYEDVLKNEQRKTTTYMPRRKVAMSVNGKSVYNVPAPSKYKADISNSSVKGEASFNIKKHEYASYYKHIRDKISLYWMLYFGTDQSIKLETKDSLPIIVEFKVDPSGKIVDVKVSENAGNPFLASRTQMSVKNTQLDKFPSNIDEEFIDVKFNFYFF